MVTIAASIAKALISTLLRGATGESRAGLYQERREHQSRDLIFGGGTTCEMLTRLEAKWVCIDQLQRAALGPQDSSMGVINSVLLQLPEVRAVADTYSAVPSIAPKDLVGVSGAVVADSTSR